MNQEFIYTENNPYVATYHTTTYYYIYDANFFALFIAL